MDTINAIHSGNVTYWTKSKCASFLCKKSAGFKVLSNLIRFGSPLHIADM